MKPKAQMIVSHSIRRRIPCCRSWAARTAHAIVNDEQISTTVFKAPRFLSRKWCANRNISGWFERYTE